MATRADEIQVLGETYTTLKRAADMLGTSVMGIDELIKDGYLSTVSIPRTSRKVLLQDVVNLASQHTVRATARASA